MGFLSFIFKNEGTCVYSDNYEEKNKLFLEKKQQQKRVQSQSKQKKVSIEENKENVANQQNKPEPAKITSIKTANLIKLAGSKYLIKKNYRIEQRKKKLI